MYQVLPSTKQVEEITVACLELIVQCKASIAASYNLHHRLRESYSSPCRPNGWLSPPSGQVLPHLLLSSASECPDSFKEGSLSYQRAQPFSGDSVALDVPPFLTPGLSGLSAAKLHFLTYPACNFFCCPLKEVSNKFILFLSIFISVKLTCVKIYWQPVYPFQRVPACPFSVCLDVPCSLPKLCRVFRSLLCVLQRKGIKRKHTISFS